MKAQEFLYTDRYELSMLDGALVSGIDNAEATFEVFTRSLANAYRYGVVAGTGRLIEDLANSSFDEDTNRDAIAQMSNADVAVVMSNELS